jgi:hypothetical protein
VQPTAAATAFETVISTVISAVTAPPSLAATTPLDDVPDDNGFGKDDVVGNDDNGLGGKMTAIVFCYYLDIGTLLLTSCLQCTLLCALH